MSVLTSLGIIVFAMLILSFMQLVPGVFALFSHYAFGKYSKTKASNLSLFFIFGVEFLTTILFIIIYFILMALYPMLPNPDLILWILCGIFIALSIASLLFYFRKGTGTKLFISRKLAKSFITRSASIKKRSDAFILGLTSTIPELIFTLPIYTISALEIMNIGETPITRALLVFLFIIATIATILTLFLRSNNHNLADYLKFRLQNKNFFRFFIAISYLIIAILIITGILL